MDIYEGLRKSGVEVAEHWTHDEGLHSDTNFDTEAEARERIEVQTGGERGERWEDTPRVVRVITIRQVLP